MEVKIRPFNGERLNCADNRTNPSGWEAIPDDGTPHVDRYMERFARRVCPGCPGRAGCLEQGLATSSWPEGVWGGMTPSRMAGLLKRNPLLGVAVRVLRTERALPALVDRDAARRLELTAEGEAETRFWRAVGENVSRSALVGWARRLVDRAEMEVAAFWATGSWPAVRGQGLFDFQVVDPAPSETAASVRSCDATTPPAVADGVQLSLAGVA